MIRSAVVSDVNVHALPALHDNARFGVELLFPFWESQLGWRPPNKGTILIIKHNDLEFESLLWKQRGVVTGVTRELPV